MHTRPIYIFINVGIMHANIYHTRLDVEDTAYVDIVYVVLAVILNCCFYLCVTRALGPSQVPHKYVNRKEFDVENKRSVTQS